MERKRFYLTLVSVFILIFIAAVVAYFARLTIHKEEEFMGFVGTVPKTKYVPTPIKRGQADWPCWRGIKGDGKSTVKGIRKDWSGGLTKLWELDYLCNDQRAVTWSAPAVQGNRLVVLGRDSNKDLVFCLDPNNGELLWLESYKARTDESHGSGARATPYIDDDRVYTFGRSGVLVCWNLENGNLLWKHNVGEIGGKIPRWGHSSSPLVYDDKVFVQGGGNALVVAYNKVTGNLVWKSMTGDAGYAAPTLINVGSKANLLIFHGTGLACLEPHDGKVLWSVPWETKYNVNATTPAVTGANVFITSGYDTGCMALNVGSTGANVLWRSEIIDSLHSDPIIIDDFIYGYSGNSNRNEGYFKCVKLDDGTEKWSTDEIGSGTTLYVDGHLLCMDVEGNLFLMKPNPDAFLKVAEFKKALGEVKHPAWTIPVVANGNLYLRYMQHLVCYSLLDESETEESS